MAKIWERYTSKLADEKFDAIIIGSGISGLTTATFLSKAGKRVLVLEGHFKVFLKVVLKGFLKEIFEGIFKGNFQR